MMTAMRQTLPSVLSAQAPASADMTLAEALSDLAARLDIRWDKSMLDGYPGETGLSRRARVLTIVGSAVVSWTAIGAVAMAVLG